MRPLAMDVWFRDEFGFTEPVLAKVGKLVLGWALFEMHLETQLLQVIGFPEPGKPSAVDGDQTATRLKLLRKHGASQPMVEEADLRVFVDTAESALYYRNQLCHGVPLGQFEPRQIPAKSLNNFPWNGIPRGRKLGAAIIASPWIDQMIWVVDVLLVALGRGDRMSQIDEKLSQVVKYPELAEAHKIALCVLRDSMRDLPTPS